MAHYSDLQMAAKTVPKTASPLVPARDASMAALLEAPKALMKGHKKGYQSVRLKAPKMETHWDY